MDIIPSASLRQQYARDYWRGNPDASLRSVQRFLKSVYGRGLRHETLARIKAEIKETEVALLRATITASQRRIGVAPDPGERLVGGAEPRGTRVRKPVRSAALVAGGWFFLLLAFALYTYVTSR